MCILIVFPGAVSGVTVATQRRWNNDEGKLDVQGPTAHGVVVRAFGGIFRYRYFTAAEGMRLLFAA